MVDQQAKSLLSLEPTSSFKILFSNFKPSIINISWKNGKLHRITALEIKFVT